MTLFARSVVTRLLAVCILLASFLLSSGVAQVVAAPVIAAIGDGIYNSWGIKPFAQTLATGVEGGVSTGSLIKYGVAGAVVGLTAFGLTKAYDWFKEQSDASFSTGTSLDELRRLEDFAWFPPRVVSIQNVSIQCRVSGLNPGVAWTGYYPSSNYSDSWVAFSSDKFGSDNFLGRYPTQAAAAASFSSLACSPVVTPTPLQWANGDYSSPGPGNTVQPGIPHSDTSEGYRRVAREFVKRRAAPAARSGQGSQFGITFNPPLNPNQWDDAPNDRTIDTDGDGTTDWLEVHPLGPKPVTDPSDPYSKPAIDPNENSDQTCKTGFARSSPSALCVAAPVIDPNPTADPNANPDGTCKTGFFKPAGGGACQPQVTPSPNPDVNANPDGSCKSGFFKPSGATSCQPEKRVCEVGFKPLGADCVPDPLTLPPAPALPDILAPVKQATDQFQAEFKGLKDVALTRFPFGFATWIPTNIQTPSGDCSAEINVNMGMLGAVNFNFCNMPAVQYGHNFLRPIMLFVLILSFIIYMVKVASQS